MNPSKSVGKLQFEHFNAFRGSPNISKIDENLWLGNSAAATDASTILKYKISHILTIENNPLPEEIHGLPSIVSIKYIHLLDVKNENILKHFEETFTFINEALRTGGVVLVHCFYGMSRSATIVTAYVMKKYSFTYLDAFDFVKRKRSIISPNDGFKEQLLSYEKLLFDDQ